MSTCWGGSSSEKLIMAKKSFRGRGGGKRGKRGARKKRTMRTRQEETDEEKAISMEGTIAAVLAGTMFRVDLDNGHQALAHISGKMRKRFIRLVVGDRVKMEMSPYDTDKARIVFRL